jgi:hypothetical protein
MVSTLFIIPRDIIMDIMMGFTMGINMLWIFMYTFKGTEPAEEYTPTEINSII